MRCDVAAPGRPARRPQSPVPRYSTANRSCRAASAGLHSSYVLPAVLPAVRQAEDQSFRITYYSRATQGPRWEERDASIIVTEQSVFIHKNGKVGLDLRATSRKATEVRRVGERVIIGAGSGQSKVSWSLRPPDDAVGWAASIRAVIDPAPKPDP